MNCYATRTSRAPIYVTLSSPKYRLGLEMVCTNREGLRQHPIIKAGGHCSGALMMHFHSETDQMAIITNHALFPLEVTTESHGTTCRLRTLVGRISHPESMPRKIVGL